MGSARILGAGIHTGFGGNTNADAAGRTAPWSYVLKSPALTYYPRLCAVEAYVRAHLTDDVSLADVSKVAGLETKYFSAYFRSKVGLSFSEWLRLLRVTRAMELMQVREASVPRLAFACGFHDVRTFERAFKRFVGVPPAVYRALSRPESRMMT